MGEVCSCACDPGLNHLNITESTCKLFHYLWETTFITDCRAEINDREHLGNRSSTTDSSLLLVLRHLTLIIQQHILRFEVSVNDPLLVEVLHALDDLSSVVAGSRLVKPGVVLVHVVDVIPGRVMITTCLFSMFQ